MIQNFHMVKVVRFVMFLNSCRSKIILKYLLTYIFFKLDIDADKDEKQLWGESTNSNYGCSFFSRQHSQEVIQN